MKEIQAVLKAEEEAENVLAKAQKKKENTITNAKQKALEMVAEEKAAIDAAMDAQVQKTVKSLEKKQHTILTKSEETIAALQKTVAKNHDAAVEMVFGEVMGK